MGLHEQLHNTPRYSDNMILVGFFRWKGWATLRDTLFNRHIRIGLFIYTAFVRTLAILAECFAYPLRCFFRHKSGKLGGNGFFMLGFSGWMIALFNNESSFIGYYSYISKSFEFIYVLIFTWHYEQFASDEFIAALWQPQSSALTIFLCCFLVAAIIQIITRKLGYRSSNSWSKGQSVIWSVTHKYVRLSRGFWEVLFEASAVVVVGLLVDHFLADFRFALYLYISAFCLFAQELADYLARVPFQK
ncbi:hypothetical protein [Aquimarina macrocephali]|uniref:hypothetical protein n=1 Tax=Aquimarina macrocephali TaxID=666563 RepID=UPI00046786FE|nr:hypothetical protein [Aquimarina macrocephali]